MFLFYCIVFVSSFLLFQIELIVAKLFLPFYGGNYLVWGACVVFFQGILFLGYLHTHVLVEKLGLSRYRLVHIFLLILPALFFPGKNLHITYPSPGIPIIFSIFFQLTVSLGPVFFFLSTVSIVLQRSLAASSLSKKNNPYALFGISNLGSFLALISYPFFIEVHFDLDQQVFLWRGAYALLVFLHGLAFCFIRFKEEKDAPAALKVNAPVSSTIKISWLILSAASVMMFLSVTNIVTSAVAPIPLFWVLPLCIYLLSFVLNFKNNPWCPKSFMDTIGFWIGFSIITYLLDLRSLFPAAVVVGLFCLILFIFCMYCQRELYRLRPSTPKGLSLFYVVMAGGGFIGGVVVSWLMPLISTSFIEYFFSLSLIALYLMINNMQGSFRLYDMRLFLYMLIFIFCGPLFFPEFHSGVIILIVLGCSLTFECLRRKPVLFFLCLFAVILLEPLMEAVWIKEKPVVQHRNYYGIYKVDEWRGIRYLIHSTTIHGAQCLMEGCRHTPLTYFAPSSIVGRLLTDSQFDFKRIAVIGLGTGSLAAYTHEGQAMDFYELDGDVLRMAQKYFSYLRDAKGTINVILGDARLSLKKKEKKIYDILIVDAFSGDSVPTHLLTIEALREFRQHLKENGLMLFHISNLYLEVGLVLAKNVEALQGITAFANNPLPRHEILIFPASWILVSWDKEDMRKLGLMKNVAWRYIQNVATPKRYWTDNYSNYLSIIKKEALLHDLKKFKLFE